MLSRKPDHSTRLSRFFLALVRRRGCSSAIALTQSVTRLVAFLVLATSPNWLVAQSPAPSRPSVPESIAVESLIPSDAALYVALEGAPTSADAWKKTAAYEALVKSDLGPALQRWIESGLSESPAEKRFAALLQRVLERGLTLSLSIRPQGQGTLEFEGLLIWPDAAEWYPDLRTLLKQYAPALAERQHRGFTLLTSPETTPAAVRWQLAAVGPHLVFGDGQNVLPRALDRLLDHQPNVTAHRLWKSSREFPAGVTPGAVGWVDVQGLYAVVKDEPAEPRKAGSDQPVVTVGQMLATLGIDRLQELFVQQGYEGRACWNRTRLNFTGPRTQLFALWNVPALELGQLPPLPETTPSLSVGNMPWTTLHDAVLTALEQNFRLSNQANDWEDFSTRYAAAQDRLGFRIRDDFLASLGPTTALYADESNTFGGVGFAVVFQVRDAARLRKVIDAMAGRFPQTPGGPQLNRSQKRGRELYSLGQPPVPYWPTLCLDRDWLIIGLTPQLVESFLMRRDGDLDSWKPTPDVQRALTVGTDVTNPAVATPLAINVTDSKPLITGLMALAPSGEGLLRQQWPLLARKLQPLELPEPRRVTKPLFPNITVGTATEGRIEWVTRSSLPSIPGIGGVDGVSIPTAAIGIAVLLPAVQQAREAARRTQSANHLKQIGLALHNAHDALNRFPTGTVVASAAKPEDRLSWQVTILPYIEQQALHQTLDMTRGAFDPGNQPKLSVNIPVFRNPSLRPPEGQPEVSYTDYVGIAGLGENGPLTKPRDKGAGLFAYDHPRSIRDITDGTSNTLMVGEVSKDRGAWGQGGRSTLRPLIKPPYVDGADGFGGGHVRGAYFLYVDGSVQFTAADIDPSVLEKRATIAGGEIVPWP